MTPDTVEAFLGCRRSLIAARDALTALELPPPESDGLDPAHLRLAEDLVDTVAQLVAVLDLSLPELALERLLAAAPRWQHPAEVLEEPRPSYRQLARLAAERLETPGGKPKHLRLVHGRLLRTIRIQEAAKRRRRSLPEISEKNPESLGDPGIDTGKQ